MTTNFSSATLSSTFTQPVTSNTCNTTDCTRSEDALSSGLMLQAALVLVVMGNLLVLLALCSYKRWTSPDILVFSLSLADLLDSLIGLQTLTIVKYYLQIPWTRWLCDVYVTLLYTFRMASGSTVTFMAAERAVLVVYPIEHHTMVRPTRVKKIVLGVWLCAVFVSVLPLVGVGHTGFRDRHRTCLFQLYDLGLEYAILIEVLGCVHLLLTLASYVAIQMSTKRFVRRQTAMGVTASRKISKQVLCQSPEKVRTTTRAMSGVKRLNVMMGIVVLVYYISWLPFLFNNLASLITDREPDTKLSLFAGLISLLHALVNPILYGRMSQRYHRGYVHVVRTMLMVCGAKKPANLNQVFSYHSNVPPVHVATNMTTRHSVDNPAFLHDNNESTKVLERADTEVMQKNEPPDCTSNAVPLEVSQAMEISLENVIVNVSEPTELCSEKTR